MVGKRETAVQNCVTTRASMKPFELCIFDEMSGQFAAENQVFLNQMRQGGWQARDRCL